MSNHPDNAMYYYQPRNEKLVKLPSFCGKFYTSGSTFVSVNMTVHTLLADLGWDQQTGHYVFLVLTSEGERLLVSRYVDGSDGVILTDTQLELFMKEIAEGETPTSFHPKIDFAKYIKGNDWRMFSDMFKKECLINPNPSIRRERNHYSSLYEQIPYIIPQPRISSNGLMSGELV